MLINAQILEVDKNTRTAIVIVRLSGACAEFLEIKGRAFDKFWEKFPITICGG